MPGHSFLIISLACKMKASVVLLHSVSFARCCAEPHIKTPGISGNVSLSRRIDASSWGTVHPFGCSVDRGTIQPDNNAAIGQHWRFERN